MGYFLKKTKNNKGVYLQIYESFYDPTRKQTAHRSVRPVGYVHELKAGGIDDPVAHFKREVDAMNERRLENESRARVREIGEEGAERMLGYFPLKGVNSLLGVERDFDEANRLYEQAVELGSYRAADAIAKHCEKGTCGRTVDFAKAVEYREKAAALGSVSAALALYVYYTDGVGDVVKRDDAKAVAALLIAAEQNDYVALSRLAEIYRNGWRGVEKDEKKADDFAKRAAKVAAGR